MISPITSVGSQRTHFGRLCARDHLLGSGAWRSRIWIRGYPGPAARGRIETTTRLGRVFRGRMDLDDPPFLLSHARTAKSMERKQGDQNRSRRHRDRTEHWTASCSDVSSTSTTDLGRSFHATEHYTYHATLFLTTCHCAIPPKHWCSRG
jgi:hypothetical protein